ncbi:hypothetical protein PPERSA_04888 [Pseudocohnilembus persalinus]|uniref:Uncharacterized protein n=1 Tax=Pseudocohnilembus persalinus TaxID=266149 RepID=A0A0V0QJL9_PSEPJ|nr:hypothetical protein PPERSA_04888 [Pseudocohnilembus persalinus]|eukprot:KRX02266.1 hypothetical protein PPERSA_04888 [Pseudocohnilembus persalinus]
MEENIIQILKKSQQIFEHREIQNNGSSNNLYKWTSLLQGQEALPLDIQEKKPFIQTKTGWQWFKNLVIPTIKVFPKNAKCLQQFQKENDIKTVKKFENDQSLIIEKSFQEKSIYDQKKDEYLGKKQNNQQIQTNTLIQNIKNENEDEIQNETKLSKKEDLNVVDKENLSNQQKSDNQDENIENSQCQYLGKLECYKKLSNNVFEPVNITGVKDKELVDFNLSFKSLKFEETSFMTRSVYFIIVVSIYENPKMNGGQAKLLNLFVSPQLSVDARKKYWSERQAQVQIFDPFLPNLADKQYEKVSKKDGHRCAVSNDLVGLENYFTSYSIRHKIRNPFFLLFKFPLGVKLYYNSSCISQQVSSEDELLIAIYKEIFKCFMNEQEDDTPKHKRPLQLCLNAKDDDIKIKDSVQKVNQQIPKYT